MLDRLRQRVPWHAFLLPLLGILLYRLTAYSVYGSAFATAVDAYAYSRLAQLAATVALVVYAGYRQQTATQLRRLVVAGTLTMVVGAALSVGFPPETGAFTLGRILHGVGSAVLFVGWGAYTCTLAPRWIAASVSAAFAAYSVVTFGLQYAPPAAISALALVLPVLCGSLLVYGAPHMALPSAQGTPEGGKGNGRRASAPEHPAAPASATGTARLAGRAAGSPSDGLGETFDRAKLPWGVLGLLAACSFVCAVTELFIAPDAETLGTYASNAFRIPVFCIIALFFAIWIRLGNKDNPDQLWALFALVISCGLLGYSSFSPFSPNVALAFMRATQDCLMMFAWIYIAGLVWRTGLPALATFGLATILFMRTDLPASIVRMAVPDFEVPSGGLMTTGLSFAMALALIVYTIVLANRHPLAPDVPAASPSAGPSDQAPAATAILAGSPGTDTSWTERFNLSARESQVVELLLHGYTLPQLADKLGISLNTARWYAKGIYRKLAIHSKSELIELAESCKGESGRH